jgi:hypothetical protein
MTCSKHSLMLMSATLYYSAAAAAAAAATHCTTHCYRCAGVHLILLQCTALQLTEMCCYTLYTVAMHCTTSTLLVPMPLSAILRILMPLSATLHTLLFCCNTHYNAHCYRCAGMGGALSFAGISTHRSRPEPDCNDGYAECVSMLLAAGADPNVTSIQGKSCLLHAHCINCLLSAVHVAVLRCC